VPHPFSDLIFLAALFVPAAMSIAGVVFLMASLVAGHFASAHEPSHSIEAPAH
jgi:hypothetical protein